MVTPAGRRQAIPTSAIGSYATAPPGTCHTGAGAVAPGAGNDSELRRALVELSEADQLRTLTELVSAHAAAVLGRTG
ncbi:hypothetical protein VM98_37775, partial [Streptomyces rubellomurinus subsp. indigoferus]